MSLLVDTGPLLALLDRNDSAHEWVKSQLAQHSGALLTCEAVLSETFFLLKRQKLATSGLTQLIERDILKTVALSRLHSRIAALMDKYADLPTSYADICLLVLNEEQPNVPLLTLDSDFRIYRRKDRSQPLVIMPSDD